MTYGLCGSNMPGKVKVNGAWKDVPEIYTKVNGAWKSVVEAYSKVNGAWQQWFALTGGLTLISETNITSNVTSVTLNSNGAWANFKHIYVVASYQTGSSASRLDMKVNGDGQYDYVFMGGKNTQQTVSFGVNQARVRSSDILNGPDTGNGTTITKVWLPYLNDNDEKTFHGVISGISDNGGGIESMFAHKRSLTSAITSLELKPEYYGIAAGSSFLVYGYGS